MQLNNNRTMQRFLKDIPEGRYNNNNNFKTWTIDWLPGADNRWTNNDYYFSLNNVIKNIFTKYGI